MGELQGPRQRGKPTIVADTRYVVVGRHAVHGVAPGGTLTAELAVEHERYLIAAGHIRVVEPKLDDTDTATE